MNSHLILPTSKVPPSGFSLIELLVVMAIVGTLAGLLYTAAGAAALRAKIARTTNMCYNLKSAIATYATEYRKLPITDFASPNRDIEMQSDHELMDILCASPSQRKSGGMNPRGIVFYSGRTASRIGIDRYHSGLHIASDGSTALFDPWGEHIQVILDGDSDGKIKKPSWDKINPSSEISDSILVWSTGPEIPDHTDNIKLW